MNQAVSLLEKYSEEAVALEDLLIDVELVQGESLVPQVYRLIRDRIVDLRLKPGQLVSEKEIAEILRASKTPVREALIKLENDGLVEVIPKSGTYVTPIRINKYIDACFTRLQLEMGAVKRAASQSIDSSQIVLLDDILQDQADALSKNDYKTFFEKDQALHKGFFQVAGVIGVWDLMLRTQANVNRMRHLKRIKKIQRGPEVLEEHHVIVKAIRDRNPEAAAEALVNHIGSLEKEIEQLSTNPALLEFIDKQSTPFRRARSVRKSGE